MPRTTSALAGALSALPQTMTDLFGHAFGVHTLLSIQPNQMEVVAREVNRCADVFKQVFLFEWPAGYLSFVVRYLSALGQTFEMFPTVHASNQDTVGRSA